MVAFKGRYVKRSTESLAWHDKYAGKDGNAIMLVDKLLFEVGNLISNVVKDNYRVVAVGDLHGDVVRAQAVLRMSNLTDQAGSWVGGKATLIQTVRF
ncbi:hypothetical protein DSO57_1017447 [Entomophthora muscae]|uniref:Uncharacterized protein n=2 Tax=Entomophthora muscae TaxID=34485 RepID=A0ACC2RDL9_9FUNG|nr:hypothetical protein DSO57_1038025 [Entomophthora muscae]KAJ9050111.1 hypothetical protein DSO57_1017447 [Entomophthora muscae]